MAPVVVITTTGTADTAAALARGLVEHGLAACAQIIGPIRSVYRWNGDLHDDTEYQCVLKTTEDHVDAITTYLDEHHDYDVPEVIALPVVAGSPAYLSWVTEQTR